MYFFDAGPNAVLIARNRKTAAVLLQRLLYFFPPNADTDTSSYILGDKSILKSRSPTSSAQDLGGDQFCFPMALLNRLTGLPDLQVLGLGSVEVGQTSLGQVQARIHLSMDKNARA